MKNWCNENYAMQHTMTNIRIPMNIMPPAQPLLPPMCLLPNVRPANAQVPVNMLFMAPPPPPPPNTNQDNESVEMEDAVITGETNLKHRNNGYKRNCNLTRDCEGGDNSGRRSRSNDRDCNKQDIHENGDRNIVGREKIRWIGVEKEITCPQLRTPGGVNARANMMVRPGMPPYNNPMHNSMMQPNIVLNISDNMMNHPQMEPNPMRHIRPQAMNMMPNMMAVNTPKMPLGEPQTIYTGAGYIIPPLPGFQIPERRQRPNGCRTIFVSGLPATVTVDTVNEMFQRFGPMEYVRSPRAGAFHVRFVRTESVNYSLCLTGHRFKFHHQTENEATTVYVDFAMNREDHIEYDKQQRHLLPTPPGVEPFTPSILNSLSEKIKTEEEFSKVAPTLAAWLERGEVNRRNANSFYSLVQASNHQIRRLNSQKMQLDEEFQTLRVTCREKFGHVLLQFEQVAKILSAAKHQRVSDHFTKQQRRNVEMWVKMTEDVENIREEFHAKFDDDDEAEKIGKKYVPIDMYEELKVRNEKLAFELEGYKNAARLAKEEEEAKMEKFKAHFIAQQALQNKQSVLPPFLLSKPLPPSSHADNPSTLAKVPPSEAKFISILTAFLMVHPLGVSLDYLTSYVNSIIQNVNETTVKNILQKYGDVFQCKITGIGASIDRKWMFVAFDNIKNKKI